jgi:hypothetical protein
LHNTSHAPGQSIVDERLDERDGVDDTDRCDEVHRAHAVDRRLLRLAVEPLEPHLP